MSLPDLIELSPNIEFVSAENPNDDDPCISSISISSTVVAATQLCGNVALFETNNYFRNNNNNQQQQQNPKPFTTFRAHADALNNSKFLSKVGNGTFLATCSDDSSVRIFDCKNINNNNRGYPIALYPAPAEVNCMCESSDGRKLYAGCDDGSVIVYTYGEFADATTLQNENNQQSDGNNSSSSNPYPNAAPPANVERFMVGEGSVNDLIVVAVPYGDLLFTATDDGSVRGWKTVPGQKAPNESNSNQPSREDIQRQMNDAMNENEEQVNNNEISEEDRQSADTFRQMIADSLGDESADRLLTSFDTFKGGQINHIVSTTIGGDAAVLVATANYIFAVLFDVSTGQLAEEPAIMFQGNDDFVRGLHPMPNGNNFVSVADDGVVCLFPRDLKNQQEPVDPVKKFQAEKQGLNIMSSAMTAEGILLTGSLFGSVKMWQL